MISNNLYIPDNCKDYKDLYSSEYSIYFKLIFMLFVGVIISVLCYVTLELFFCKKYSDFTMFRGTGWCVICCILLPFGYIPMCSVFLLTYSGYNMISAFLSLSLIFYVWAIISGIFAFVYTAVYSDRTFESEMRNLLCSVTFFLFLFSVMLYIISKTYDEFEYLEWF